VDFNFGRSEDIGAAVVLWCQSKAISLAEEPAFPHLDIELHWSVKEFLQLQAHQKPSQALKHFNKGSSHLTL